VVKAVSREFRISGSLAQRKRFWFPQTTASLACSAFPAEPPIQHPASHARPDKPSGLGIVHVRSIRQHRHRLNGQKEIRRCARQPVAKETCRCDSGDRHRFCINPERAAHHRGIARLATLPSLVAHHPHQGAPATSLVSTNNLPACGSSPNVRKWLPDTNSPITDRAAAWSPSRLAMIGRYPKPASRTVHWPAPSWYLDDLYERIVMLVSIGNMMIHCFGR
jgi:hypothetical protein